MEMKVGYKRELDWIKVGVKREVGVDADEVEERVGRNDKMRWCLRFTHGFTICLLYIDDHDSDGDDDDV